MLKTSRSIESKTRPDEGRVEIGSSKAGREESKLDGSEFHGDEVDGGEVEDDEVEKKVQKKSKSKNLSKSTLDFLSPEARLAFIKLRQVFLKALIFQHFDLKCHIRMETDVSGYAIGGILS